ncbi:DUF1501 domain-containing protein [bacterium]|nr:DUF1501 domain-containing protein [bacterium]
MLHHLNDPHWIGGHTLSVLLTNSYNIVKDPVHIRDFHATVLHLLGFDHERLTYRHLGLDQKLTGVEHAKIIQDLLA